MFCVNCGNEQDENVKFCSKCGEKAELPQQPSAKDGEVKNWEIEKFSKITDPTEELICVLGKNYAEAFLADGSLSPGFAVLSNKRVYFKGDYLVKKDDGSFDTDIKNRFTYITEVTGADLTHVREEPLGYFVVVAVCVLLAIVHPILRSNFIYNFVNELAGASVTTPQGYQVTWLPLIFIYDVYSFLISLGNWVIWVPLVVAALLVVLYFVMYFSGKEILFEISYSGKSVAFDTKHYEEAEILEFQRNIQLVKTKVRHKEKFGQTNGDKS